MATGKRKRQPPTVIDWQQWDRMHHDAEAATVQHWDAMYDNRPVPRRASCHYLAIDADPRNFYFY